MSKIGEVDLMSYRPFMRLDILVPLATAAVDPKALAAVGDAAQRSVQRSTLERFV